MHEPLFMTCGHTANATIGGQPACSICSCTTVAKKPDLTGRTAECYCGKEVPSSFDLAFFEFCGPGSREATMICKRCAMHKVAHGSNGTIIRGKYAGLNMGCKGFEPKGDSGRDRWYCGHAGWD